MKDILSIREGQCRYCLTEDTPFLFCGDPVQPGTSYCPEHYAVCHTGPGRDVALLESMIYGMDWSITRAKNDRPNTLPTDVFIRGGE